MSIFDRPRQVTKIFQSLGIWTIPLLSTPLLLPVVLVPSLSPFSRSANKSQTPALEQPSANTSAVSQWEQLIQQGLNQTNSPATKTNQPKTSPQTAANSSLATKTTKPSTNRSTATKPHVKAAAKSRSRKHKKVAKKPQYTPPVLEIRVAIANDVDSLALGSSTPAYIQATNGKLLQKLPAAQAFNAIPNQSTIAIGDWQLPNAVWIQPTKGGAIYVGDRWYRGKLLLVSQASKLLAVNYVDLEHYLYSVVGSEMHAGAPAEALKAQAVAARSYALVHLVRPASSWYNLGATERWQVYKGMNSEYNTTQKAVKDTGGQILSYKGGIVESLYASTDEIVAKAHGGRGMSQTGAYQLAGQGYNYLQILGYYYPGAATARLELKR